MKNRVIRYVFWALTLAIMIFIFCHSAETAEESSKTSMSFTQTVITVVYPEFSELPEAEKTTILESLQHLVRKGAHFSVYLLLGVTSFSAFCSYDLKRYIKALAAFLLCALYAASDEFHQLFVAGRSGQISDILLDSAGSLCGIVITVGIIFIYRNLRKGRRKNEQ